MPKYQTLTYQLTDNQLLMNWESHQIQPLNIPSGHVLVAIHYSSINHKDVLATQPNSGVVRQYPITGGIDFAGEVLASADDHFKPGVQVIGTGFEIGLSSVGGFATCAIVPGKWLLRLPIELSMQQAMYYGTAGLSAGIALTKLLNHPQLANRQVPLLITGVTGGVGGIALSILSHLGYTNLTVVSRQAALHDTLLTRGASNVITPEQLASSDRPLQKQNYFGVIDTIGGDCVGHIVSQIAYGGALALVGNAAGATFQTSVYPFILRGINVYGVDSVAYPLADRAEIWKLLATQFACPKNEQVPTTLITKSQLIPTLIRLQAQPLQGRYLVHLR